MSPEEIKSHLFSESAKEIKMALDALEKTPDQAVEFRERINELRNYSEGKVGIGAVQVEVAAIILWSHMNFKK